MIGGYGLTFRQKVKKWRDTESAKLRTMKFGEKIGYIFTYYWKWMLLFLIAAVAVNVVLDLTLIAGVGMGVEGAAYATVASQAASGLACLIYIRLRVPMLRLRRADLRPDWRELGHIAGIGVPMGLQFSITAVGTILIQGAVNSLGAAAVLFM